MPYAAKVPLSQELIEGVCAQIASTDPEVSSAGLHAGVAAVRLGVPRQSFHRWVKRGRELVAEEIEPRNEFEELCVELVLRVEQAEADCEFDWVQRKEAAIQANKRSWAGHMTNLERRFPSRYRRPSVSTQKPDAPVSMEEELERLAAESA